MDESINGLYKAIVSQNNYSSKELLISADSSKEAFQILSKEETKKLLDRTAKDLIVTQATKQDLFEILKADDKIDLRKINLSSEYSN